MAATLAGLVREWQRVKTEFMAAQVPDQSTELHKYAGRPVDYAREVLRSTLTPDQAEILNHLHVPPCKVLVPSGHDTGKSYVAACAVNYWFDVFPESVAITTAPTERDVKQILWTEVRLQRRRAGLPNYFIGPAAPEMRTGEDHFAIGYTARKGESFQGRHRNRMLFVFDESNGIEAVYWDGVRTMFDPDLGHAWLAIFNPTSTSTRAYIEDNLVDEEDEHNKPWHRFRLSALEHPNIKAELTGQPKPVPGAVSVRMVEEWVRDWCEPVADLGDVRVTDVEWPPSAVTGKPGKWYRPGPIFQCRAMGLWPDAGDGVWSDLLWLACERRELVWNPALMPQVGCDTAMGRGDDWHAIHCQWGGVSLPEGHQTANTMDPVRIAGKLRELTGYAARFATGRRDPKAPPVEPKKVPIKIDDDGTGNAVWAILSREGWNIQLVGAGCAASQPTLYPRRRDELWFQSAVKARKGFLSTRLLDRATRRRLKQQLLAPAWDLDLAGRRHVEAKEITKEKLGRSPDDADAYNLSHFDAGATAPSVVELPEDTEYKGGHYAKRRQGGRW